MFKIARAAPRAWPVLNWQPNCDILAVCFPRTHGWIRSRGWLKTEIGGFPSPDSLPFFFRHIQFLPFLAFSFLLSSLGWVDQVLRSLATSDAIVEKG
jgi:hypothetical protein